LNPFRAGVILCSMVPRAVNHQRAQRGQSPAEQDDRDCNERRALFAPFRPKISTRIDLAACYGWEMDKKWTGPHRRWTDEDIARLRILAENVSTEQIARELGRSEAAVRMKAALRGIALPRPRDERP
jgi:hypothetical protein